VAGIAVTWVVAEELIGQGGGMVLAMIDEPLHASIAKQMMSGNTGDAD